MKDKKNKYPVVGVLWEDHSKFTGDQLPPTSDISEYVRPSLTLGLLYKETKKYIILIQHIERYEDRDEVDFFIIFKGTILGTRQYGEEEVRNIRKKGA